MLASWHVDKGGKRGEAAKAVEARRPRGLVEQKRDNASGGGPRARVAGKTSSGLGSQVTGYRARVVRFGFGFGPEPAPDAEHPNLRPDGRDLRPENES